MDNLVYDYGYNDCNDYIRINSPSIVKIINFNDIQWNIVIDVACYITCISKRVYNFILRLPRLKLLRFRDSNYNLYLITYNSKFFKHKSLLMYAVLHNTAVLLHCSPNIIFIL